MCQANKRRRNPGIGTRFQGEKKWKLREASDYQKGKRPTKKNVKELVER